MINLPPWPVAFALSSFLAASLTLSFTAKADVLAPDEYVLSYNLSYGDNAKEESFPSGTQETVQETTFTHSLTGLVGLGILPWQHHLYFSAALKSVQRVGEKTGLEYSDLAVIDTKLALQHLLFNYQPQYASYGFEVSGRTGLNLPTTPEGYRLIDTIDNPTDEDAIENTFDKGTLGFILGLNLSGYYNIFWSDLELSVKSDFEDRWRELSTTLGLGVSLSRLLAVQTSYSMVASTEFDRDSTSSEIGLGVVMNLTDTWSAGVGGYHNTPDSGNTENSFYVSLRTQSL